jgi:glycogen(starch) synthase
MHVLMLGWEFPPFITGGLGTACFGLTKALDRRRVHVTFVLPKAAGVTEASHVDLVAPNMPQPMIGGPAPSSPKAQQGDPAEHDDTVEAPSISGSPASTSSGKPGHESVFRLAQFLQVEAGFTQPYQRTTGASNVGDWEEGELVEVEEIDAATGEVRKRMVRKRADSTGQPGEPMIVFDRGAPAGGAGTDYGGDLIGQVERYAHFCLSKVRSFHFDVIHAHDWLTFPAGLTIARITGKPLVVHVHSTEFDRSGEHVNQRIYEIERRGMHGAMRVVAVSQLTKNIIVRRYGVPERKVEVVYNGVELDPGAKGITGIQTADKIVLYFGRITYQKGPEYFIRAAKRVLEVMDNVKFVVAGSGDQAVRMIEMAANLGIGHKVLFTGFLRGKDIQRVFSLADVYVMPSVSEPFGIAPLEAMSHDVPVLISKSSGVSEVLTHALKVDFWDTDDMANKIVAVLRHPPLSSTLREHGAFEIRRLSWDGAAERCEQIYRAATGEMTHHALTHS